MQSNLIQNIGWIGTGVMGKSMVKHLLKAGYNLKVYNRTQQKTEELVQQGAEYMQPQQLAQQCDLIFLMLGYPKDIEDILFNKEKLIDFIKPNTYLVDHTTSSPDLAKRIYQECIKRQIHVLDAPVSGGDIGAREGKLAIMTGGNQQTFDTLQPILKNYGTNIQFLGQAGNGQHCKMVNQITIALNMMGVCEALLYGYKAGLNLNLVIDTISTGAAGSFSLSKLGPRILNRDFEPGFFVEHFVKDMEIALDEAKRVNLALPGLALVRQFYEALIAQGGARIGTQALMLVLERFNNIDMSKQKQN